MDKDLRALLKRTFGFDDFRPAQREVVDFILAGRNVVGVMPTGSGKSLCYQMPALALPGLTMVVSPLIALMKDQMDGLERLGIPASVVNSSISRVEQWSRIEKAIRGDIKLLYVAPERFQNEEFRKAMRRATVSLFAVDEAHCVSLWGHDFRPDYLRLRRVIEDLGRPPVVALTATATPAVREDIVTQLGIEGAAQIVSGFDRPNLYLEVQETATTAEKVQAIANLCAWARTGIVYAGTRRNVEDIHKALRKKGVDAVAYHAGLTTIERKAVQERFMSKECGVIVATNAFGMGIDRSDVRFVVHADIPDSLEGYYQEIGRAGRDGQPARCLLLFNYADKWIPELFIDASHPPADYLRQVFVKLLNSGSAVIVGEPWKQVTARMDQRFHAAVSLLQRAGYVDRVHSAAGSGVRVLKTHDRSLAEFNFQELERRRQFEYKKLAVMLQYASRFKKHCFRSFILRYFGEWSRVQDCGNCSRCAPDRRLQFMSAASSAEPSTTRGVARAAPQRTATDRVDDAAGSVDSLTVALKVLSCVLRANEQIGREKVAKILAGSGEGSIESFRQLSTYGLLKAYSIRTIVGFVDHLILEGYIDGGAGYRPVLKVTPLGRQLLKERSAIVIPGV